MTKPNISFLASVVTCESHWNTIVWILITVRGHQEKGPVYITRVTLILLDTQNVDWAGYDSDKRSTSGYCVLKGGNLISWKSRKQNVIANCRVNIKERNKNE